MTSKIWENLQSVPARRYCCAYCGATVASAEGWEARESEHGPCIGVIHICLFCNNPSFFKGRGLGSHNELLSAQIPGVAFGNPVGNVPKEINTIYEEARKCTSAGAHTAAVMACRKLLMHIAVEEGAKPGESFISYVDYLADKGFVPPHGKHWVDHIREKGNEANHKIKLMSDKDAEELITFIEMLLRFIYEFPGKIPKPEQPKT